MRIDPQELDRLYKSHSLQQLIDTYGDTKDLRDALRASKLWNKEGSKTRQYLDRFEAQDNNPQIMQGDSFSPKGDNYGEEVDKALADAASDQTMDFDTANQAFNPPAKDLNELGKNLSPYSKLPENDYSDEPYNYVPPTRKELRKVFADDNKSYLNALKENDIENPKHLGPQSIMDAYYDGRLDRDSRNFYIADAISKFLRNTGRDVGNIGAQFSGGTIDNNRDEALWNKVANTDQDRLLDVEGNELTGSTQNQNYRSAEAGITSQNIQNRVNTLKKEGAETFDKHRSKYAAEAAKARAAGDEKNAYAYQVLADAASLITSQSTGEMGTEEYAALAAFEAIAANPKDNADILANLGEMLKSGAATTDKVLGLLASGMSAVGDFFENVGGGVSNFMGKVNDNDKKLQQLYKEHKDWPIFNGVKSVNYADIKGWAEKNIGYKAPNSKNTEILYDDLINYINKYYSDPNRTYDADFSAK